MPAPRSRFHATADTMKAVLAALKSDNPGVASVAVNPVPEDLDPGSDRIHAVMMDGELSDTAIVASVDGLVLERRGGIVEFKPWDIAIAADAFVFALHREIHGPVAQEALPAPATRMASKPVTVARELPAARVSGPKARFRSTIEAIGLVRGSLPDIDGLKGIVVNPIAADVDDAEDRVYAILESGEISDACLYCGRDGYALASAHGLEDDLALSNAAAAFLAAVSAEASPCGPRMH